MKVIRFLCSVGGFVGSVLAVKLMWDWFIVPLGLPSINYAHAYGINIILTFITMQFNTYLMKTKHSEEEKTVRATFVLFVPYITLLMAFIAKSFM